MLELGQESLGRQYRSMSSNHFRYISLYAADVGTNMDAEWYLCLVNVCLSLFLIFWHPFFCHGNFSGSKINPGAGNDVARWRFNNWKNSSDFTSNCLGRGQGQDQNASGILRCRHHLWVGDWKLRFPWRFPTFVQWIWGHSMPRIWLSMIISHQFEWKLLRGRFPLTTVYSSEKVILWNLVRQLDVSHWVLG